MSILRQVQQRLDAVEQGLVDRPHLAAEVRTVRQLLAAPAGQWLGTVEAQRLLGVQSVNTVKAWARGGILRSRQLPNGRLQVYLDDVLREREAGRVMAAFPDDTPMTDEERRAARKTLTPEVQAILDDLIRHLEPQLARLSMGGQ